MRYQTWIRDISELSGYTQDEVLDLVPNIEDLIDTGDFSQGRLATMVERNATAQYGSILQEYGLLDNDYLKDTERKA